MQDFNPQNLRYAKLVDRYARYIESPVLRLQFLNSALKLEPPNRLLMKLPMVGTGCPTRHAHTGVVKGAAAPGTGSIDKHSNNFAALPPSPRRLRRLSVAFALMSGRRAWPTSGLKKGGQRVSSLAFKRGFRWSGGASSTHSDGRGRGRSGSGDTGSEAGLTLDKVWLAERGKGYEFYSNGARVLTGPRPRGRAQLLPVRPRRARGGVG